MHLIVKLIECKCYERVTHLRDIVSDTFCFRLRMYLMTSMAMGQQEGICWRSALRQTLHAERFYWRTVTEDVKEFVRTGGNFVGACVTERMLCSTRRLSRQTRKIL